MLDYIRKLTIRTWIWTDDFNQAIDSTHSLIVHFVILSWYSGAIQILSVRIQENPVRFTSTISSIKAGEVL